MISQCPQMMNSSKNQNFFSIFIPKTQNTNFILIFRLTATIDRGQPLVIAAGEGPSIVIWELNIGACQLHHQQSLKIRVPAHRVCSLSALANGDFAAVTRWVGLQAKIRIFFSIFIWYLWVWRFSVREHVNFYLGRGDTQSLINLNYWEEGPGLHRVTRRNSTFF